MCIYQLIVEHNPVNTRWFEYRFTPAYWNWQVADLKFTLPGI